MQELPLLERDRRPDGEEEDDEVERGRDDQDGHDVHLVGGEVVVEEVVLPAVGHQQAVAEAEALAGQAVGDGDEPPALPRRVEVASALAHDARDGAGHVVHDALAARDHHLSRQVDELVVLHLIEVRSW